MAGRHHGAGQSGNYLLNDRHGSRSSGSSCPRTWKFAVAILLVCALFLTGVVIGYCISQAALGRRLNGRCEPSRQHSTQKDMSDDSLEVLSDPRQMKMRHWNLVRHLQAADYSLPTELMYASISLVIYYHTSVHDTEADSVSRQCHCASRHFAVIYLFCRPTLSAP